jgi:hypothetical protein
MFMGGLMVVGEVEKVGRELKPHAEFAFDLPQTAGDVPLVVAEGAANAVQRPAGVLAEGQHGEAFPETGIFAAAVLLDDLPEFVRTRAGQDDLGAVRFDDRHAANLAEEEQAGFHPKRTMLRAGRV